MSFIGIENARYIDPTGTLIDLELETDEGIIPFTFDPSDTAPATEYVRERLSGLEIAGYEAPPPPSFEDLRARKYREISQAHKEHVAGSVMTSLGFPMQFDMKDSLMVEGAIKLAQASGATTIYLTDAEDVTHYDIPLADAQTVLLEMSTAFAQAHAKKQTLRAEITQATTEADLDAVKWGG
jgi:hypothetical protein